MGASQHGGELTADRRDCNKLVIFCVINIALYFIYQCLQTLIFFFALQQQKIHHVITGVV